MNKKILNLSERKTLIECMNNLHYTEYWCFNSKIVEVKKFWCALWKLCGIQTIGEIFDFIASNYPVKIEYYKREVEEYESLSIKFLQYLINGRNLLRNE